MRVSTGSYLETVERQDCKHARVSHPVHVMTSLLGVYIKRRHFLKQTQYVSRRQHKVEVNLTEQYFIFIVIL